MRKSHLRAVTAFLALALTGLASLASPAIAQDYFYTARLRSETRMTGPVEASGVLWGCQGDMCTTSGPWEQPGLVACQALAETVGEIVAYGRDGAMFDAETLAQCNSSAAPTANAAWGAIFNRTLRAVMPPGTVRAPLLTITGTGVFAAAPPPAPPPPAFAAIRRRTTELTLAGTGAFAPPPPPLPPPPPFSPVSRRVIVLTLTGTGVF